MKPNKATFNKILEQTEQENSERLMAKTQLANRGAKKSRGTNRQMTYHVKLAAPGLPVKKRSSYIKVSRDIKLSDFVVVELKRSNPSFIYHLQN